MPRMSYDDPRNKKHALGDLPAIDGVRSENIISSVELIELTGATYRQLDYWCREGIIHTTHKDMPGSGNKRYFNKDIVDRVKLIVRISQAFSRTNTPMRQIFDRYREGFIDLGDGIHLTWDVVEIERES